MYIDMDMDMKRVMSIQIFIICICLFVCYEWFVHVYIIALTKVLMVSCMHVPMHVYLSILLCLVHKYVYTCQCNDVYAHTNT